MTMLYQRLSAPYQPQTAEIITLGDWTYGLLDPGTPFEIQH